MNGTGMRLPIRAIINASGSGRPRLTPMGMAPRNSMIGIMDTRRTMKQWRIMIIIWAFFDGLISGFTC